MLKLKDKVDLKELEKIGFSKRYDTYTGELTYFEYKYYFIIYLKNKKLEVDYDLFQDNDDVQEYNDILYELIKNNLLEKVNNKKSIEK